ncbi:MAG: hypothetical protein AAB554_02970 [Patescibacteria group bacterium]
METQETHKLKKVAEGAQGSFWLRIAPLFLTAVAVCSIFMNVAQCAGESMVENVRDIYYESKVRAQDERDAAETKYAELRRDIDQMSSKDIPGGLESPAARKSFDDCLSDPVGLTLTPESLGLRELRSNWIITVHNAEPIMDDGFTFAVGDDCRIGPYDHLRVGAVVAGSYLLRPVDASSADYRSCPPSAITYVSRVNQLVERAVIQGCRARAKTLDIPPAAR